MTGYFPIRQADCPLPALRFYIYERTIRLNEFSVNENIVAAGHVIGKELTALLSPCYRHPVT
jgi:hypothetical protein